ncbi:MAG: choice-of-anchor tandem repeat NxxGxxAF-containing protein, partial [Pirellulales bacterium]
KTIDGRQHVARPEAIPGIPDINDNGNIAFKGVFADGEGIFLDDRLIVETGDTIDGRMLTSVVVGATPFKPSLNNNGDIAFVGAFEGGLGVFTQDGLIVATGDIIDGREVTPVIGQASINNRGDVVFKALLDGAIDGGLFVNQALLVAAGDTIGGKTLSRVIVSGDSPALNDSGVVAFRAFFPNEDSPGKLRRGIFTQDHLVAAEGDIIDGQRLVFMESPVLNNNGDILFQSNLFDGSELTGVIVLAELIPEPASGGLAVVAAALLLLYRGKQA